MACTKVCRHERTLDIEDMKNEKSRKMKYDGSRMEKRCGNAAVGKNRQPANSSKALFAVLRSLDSTPRAAELPDTPCAMPDLAWFHNHSTFSQLSTIVQLVSPATNASPTCQNCIVLSCLLHNIEFVFTELGMDVMPLATIKECCENKLMNPAVL